MSDLPIDILRSIFAYTITAYPEPLSLASLPLVCKTWHRASQQPQLWFEAMQLRFPLVIKLVVRDLRLGKLRERPEPRDKKDDATSTSSSPRVTDPTALNMRDLMGAYYKDPEIAQPDDDEDSDSEFTAFDTDMDDVLEDNEEKRRVPAATVLARIPSATPSEAARLTGLMDFRRILQHCYRVSVLYGRVHSRMERRLQAGNEYLKDREFEEAVDAYKASFREAEIATRASGEYFLSPVQRVVMRLTLARLYLNISSAYHALGAVDGAASSAMLALENLSNIKLIVKPSMFARLCGDLNRRVQMRIQQSMSRVMMMSMVRHSSVPVEGVGVGTLISSNRDMGGSCFDGSSVLIYEHNAGEGCQGLILNKTARINGVNRRMGGPVEVRRPVFFHNVANLPDAKRIIDGVFWGGDIEEAKRRPGARVETFYGRASWFDGQLDGEIRNGDWTWRNEDVSADMVFPRDQASTDAKEGAAGPNDAGEDDEKNA